jgi:hypothetical protein
MTGPPTNDTVRWSATRYGLRPSLPAHIPPGLAHDEAKMRALLADPDRHVVAHLLLTQHSGVKYSTLDGFNGTVVDREADGTVSIAPDQGAALPLRWLAWGASIPRPDTLPLYREASDSRAGEGPDR